MQPQIRHLSTRRPWICFTCRWSQFTLIGVSPSRDVQRRRFRGKLRATIAVHVAAGASLKSAAPSPPEASSVKEQSPFNYERSNQHKTFSVSPPQRGSSTCDKTMDATGSVDYRWLVGVGGRG